MRINGYTFSSLQDGFRIITLGPYATSHDYYYAAWQFLVATGYAFQMKDYVAMRAWEYIESGKIYSGKEFYKRYKTNINKAETPERQPTREELKEAVNDICS